MSRSEYRSPWPPGWRQKEWARLEKERWDLVIVGGGITGAGILALAARAGMRALLLEKGDFASGTSSRSSKMVHGGLRYLKHFQIKLTRESVRERQMLLQAAPGLVEPLGFIYPVYEGEKPSPWLLELGLGIYTHLAPDAGDYQRLDAVDLLLVAPGLKTRNLERAYRYLDAQTDDARLVLRVIHDGLIAGKGRAAALNYAAATALLKDGARVAGVSARDETTGQQAEARARLVINATGAWADRLRLEVGETRRLRPLRGSHLFFSLERFPVYQAIAFSHPDDGRPVFVFPWEGVALVGTTDIDHPLPLEAEATISAEEADYLLRAVQSHFPELGLEKKDVMSTQAGVRPVIDTGKADPSAESRDHVIWCENGLLTVTGGKLTTFRLIAIDALREAHQINPDIPELNSDVRVMEAFDPAGAIPGASQESARRLWGRYGAAAPHLAASFPDLLEPIPGTPYLRAELAWAAGREPVYHLDDLMLRCFRFGILTPDGGHSLLDEFGSLLKEQLGWGDKRWAAEVERYQRLLRQAHGLPAEWK
jgi:glycerol-3-phosphate dehydrogenase